MENPVTFYARVELCVNDKTCDCCGTWCQLTAGRQSAVSQRTNKRPAVVIVIIVCNGSADIGCVSLGTW